MTATKDRLGGGGALQNNEKHSLQDFDIVTTSRLGRRSFLRATGAAVAGSMATVAGFRPVAAADNDPGDPAGNSGASELTDNDPVDPALNGRGFFYSDKDPDDPAGSGRGCGVSDNDIPPKANPANWGGDCGYDSDPHDPPEWGLGHRLTDADPVDSYYQGRGNPTSGFTDADTADPAGNGRNG